MRSYERASHIDPTNAHVHYNMACVAMRQKQSSRAVEHMTRAIALRPNNATFYKTRGLANRLARRFTESAADYVKAKSLNLNLIATKQTTTVDDDLQQVMGQYAQSQTDDDEKKKKKKISFFLPLWLRRSFGWQFLTRSRTRCIPVIVTMIPGLCFDRPGFK